MCARRFDAAPTQMASSIAPVAPVYRLEQGARTRVRQHHLLAPGAKQMFQCIASTGVTLCARRFGVAPTQMATLLSTVAPVCRLEQGARIRVWQHHLLALEPNNCLNASRRPAKRRLGQGAETRDRLPRLLAPGAQRVSQCILGSPGARGDSIWRRLKWLRS
jgi:hypothetical protein